MKAFKNIVVATDFSDISDRALATGADLANQLGANLHIIHIVQIHPVNMPESGNLNVEELDALEEKSASDNMEKALKGLSDDLSVSTSLVKGDPATQVNEMVKEKDADLIVMGTHGRTGLSRLIMGSVAESVLKNSTVPVLCIKGD